MNYTIHKYDINTKTAADRAIAGAMHAQDAVLSMEAIAEDSETTLCVKRGTTILFVYEPSVGLTDPALEDLEPYDGVPADTGSL
jgi:hypothetical protein